ncbi:MAG TPA: folate-binding protein [Mycobacteriales bacterium]|nr:folate-binding protein [Mycobacteriales bacterium]
MTESPLLARPGAVAADPPDAGVAWHYGDPSGEQRALLEACGVVDRSHRDVLAVPGEDRLTWLHAITSQHLEALPDDTGAEALVLDPNGRVEHDLQLAHADGTVWVDTEPGRGADLLGYLEKMRFFSRVEPALVTDRRAVLSLAGPGTATVLGAAGLPVPDDRAAAVRAAEGVVARRMAWPAPGAVDLLVPRDRLASVHDRLRAAGAVPAGTWAWEALRVAARVPRIGCETDHRTIPHEVDWVGVPDRPLAPVHLDKGCYRGQETVARVQNLGRPPRRLVLLHLDGSDDVLPAHGDEVRLDDRAVGFVGTAARHVELGPIALAVVKRQVPDDARLVVAGVAAAVDSAA